jgi:hypothetical protein
MERIMHQAKLGSCLGILLLFSGAGSAAFAQNAIQPAKDSLAAKAQTQQSNPGSLLPANVALSVAPESLSGMKLRMGSGSTIARLGGAQANAQTASDKTTGRSFNGQLKVVAH